MSNVTVKKLEKAFSHETAVKFDNVMNLSLIQVYLDIIYPGFPFVSQKKFLIEDINNDLNTKYNINHINNWVSGRVHLPKTVKEIMQPVVLKYLFGQYTSKRFYKFINHY